MPNLFTLDRQNLTTPKVTVLGEILGLANDVDSPEEFAEASVNMLFARRLPNDSISYGEAIAAVANRPGFTAPPGIKKALTAAIMTNGSVPQ